MFRNIRCKPFSPFSLYIIYIYIIFFSRYIDLSTSKASSGFVENRESPRVYKNSRREADSHLKACDTCDCCQNVLDQKLLVSNFIIMRVWLLNLRILPHSTPDGQRKIHYNNMYLGNNISVWCYAVDFIVKPVLETQAKISPNVISNCLPEFMNIICIRIKCCY